MRGTNGKGRWAGKLLGVVLCGALVLWVGPVAMAQGGEETCYVALGDSISSGYGLEDDTQRFTQQVACENGFTLISLAQNGETSHTLLERLQDPEAMQAVAQADVISITIGGNDLMNALYEYLTQRYNESHPDSPTTVEQTREALMGGQVAMLTFAMGEIQGFSASEERQKALSQFAQNLGQVVGEIQRVNPDSCLVVANQYVDTDMMRVYSAEEIASVERDIPLGRLASPDEIAAAVLFLLDNGYVTGQTLTVDGGFTL